MPNPKPAKTVKEQIALLKSRGMIFADETAAEKLLQNISYYHLGFYWFDLRLKANPLNANNNDRLEQFRQNTAFETAIDRYNFDHALQRLLLSALKTLEASLKTNWIYYFSHKYNPLFYRDISIYETKIYKNKTAGSVITDTLNKFQASTEFFIQNYKRKHPTRPPEAWVIAEILSFGELLYFISFLGKKDKQCFAHLYAENASRDFLKQGEFMTILSQLRVIRNICAHNHWLWNRVFYNFPPAPKMSPLLNESINKASPQKLYNSLCYLAYLLRKTDTQKLWQQDLKQLMQAHPHFTSAMGFPRGWENAALWL